MKLWSKFVLLVFLHRCISSEEHVSTNISLEGAHITSSKSPQHTTLRNSNAISRPLTLNKSSKFISLNSIANVGSYSENKTISALFSLIPATGNQTIKTIAPYKEISFNVHSLSTSRKRIFSTRVDSSQLIMPINSMWSDNYITSTGFANATTVFQQETRTQVSLLSRSDITSTNSLKPSRTALLTTEEKLSRKNSLTILFSTSILSDASKKASENASISEQIRATIMTSILSSFSKHPSVISSSKSSLNTQGIKSDFLNKTMHFTKSSAILHNIYTFSNKMSTVNEIPKQTHSVSVQSPIYKTSTVVNPSDVVSKQMSSFSKLTPTSTKQYSKQTSVSKTYTFPVKNYGIRPSQITSFAILTSSHLQSNTQILATMIPSEASRFSNKAASNTINMVLYTKSQLITATKFLLLNTTGGLLKTPAMSTQSKFIAATVSYSRLAATISTPVANTQLLPSKSWATLATTTVHVTTTPTTAGNNTTAGNVTTTASVVTTNLPATTSNTTADNKTLKTTKATSNTTQVPTTTTMSPETTENPTNITTNPPKTTETSNITTAMKTDKPTTPTTEKTLLTPLPILMSEEGQKTDRTIDIHLDLPLDGLSINRIVVYVQEYKKGVSDEEEASSWYNVNSYEEFRYVKYPAIEVDGSALQGMLYMKRHRRNVVHHNMRLFKIGSQTCNNNELVCNGPLKPLRPYHFQIDAFLRRIVVKRTPFTHTYYTAGPVVRTTSTPSTGGPSLGILVLLSVILVIFLIALIVAIFVIYRRRGGRANCGSAAEELRTSLMAPCQGGRMTARSAHAAAERKSSIKGMTRPVSVRDFKAWVDRSASDSDYRFAEEFESMRDVGKFERHEIADMQENRGKNRYVNVLAYDYTRVKLSSIDDEPGSDYINASYIHGYKHPRAYIATQGPLPSTCDDFWRMCWEQHSKVIVMVTQYMERGRVKCHQYWPTKEPIKFGDVTVTMIKEEKFANWDERQFSVECEREVRTLYQFQYTAWPDHGVPKSSKELLDFVQMVRIHQQPADGPLICHCSAGVGRTGTYLCVDILLNKLQVENTVDVYGVVCVMRTQRSNMVQTEDQYIFIHRVIVDYLNQRDEKEESLTGYSTLVSLKGLKFNVGGTSDEAAEALLGESGEKDNPLSKVNIEYNDSFIESKT